MLLPENTAKKRHDYGDNDDEDDDEGRDTFTQGHTRE